MIQILKDIIAIIRFEYRWRKWKRIFNENLKSTILSHKELAGAASELTPTLNEFFKAISDIIPEIKAQLIKNRKVNSN